VHNANPTDIRCAFLLARYTAVVFANLLRLRSPMLGQANGWPRWFLHRIVGRLDAHQFLCLPSHALGTGLGDKYCTCTRRMSEFAHCCSHVLTIGSIRQACLPQFQEFRAALVYRNALGGRGSARCSSAKNVRSSPAVATLALSTNPGSGFGETCAGFKDTHCSFCPVPQS
jgi:hypothetical protein